MINLIGLTGLARSGKDTAANYITSLPHNYQTYAMAKPIKDACKIMFNWTDEHVYGDLKEVVCPIFGITPREAMQKLGTEYGRNMINNDIWTIRAELVIKANKRLVITDIRFDNEAEMIKRNGGIVVKIDRKNLPRIKGVENHDSELGISEQLIDEVIYNNQSLAMLYRKIDSVLFQY